MCTWCCNNCVKCCPWLCLAPAKGQCCGCCLPDLWSVWKATAHGCFRLTKWVFPFWSTFDGWQLQFEVECPAPKGQCLSEGGRALITQNSSSDSQQIFFRKSGEMEKFHKVSLQMFGFRILVSMCKCCFNVIFSSILYSFTHHTYYVSFLLILAD